MILDKKHALQQKLFRQFAETEQLLRQNTAEPVVTACPMY